jgi:hypothetical protein
MDCPSRPTTAFNPGIGIWKGRQMREHTIETES